VKEFGIESSVTNFEVGVPYHFEVTNEGSVNHEIMIMPPFIDRRSNGDEYEYGDNGCNGPRHDSR